MSPLSPSPFFLSYWLTFSVMSFCLRSPLTANAFSITHASMTNQVTKKWVEPNASTALHQSSIQQNIENQDLSSRIHLPNRRADEILNMEMLDKLEIVVGRVAMVGASGLFFKEVLTGMSIVEQVADLAVHIATSLN